MAIAILCLVTILSSSGLTFEFTKTSPVYYSPTNMKYVVGHNNTILRIRYLNPCRAYFDNFTNNKTINTNLIDDCCLEFRSLSIGVMRNCKHVLGNQWHLTNTNEIKTKRVVPALAALGYVLVAGGTTYAIYKGEINANNAVEIAKVYNQGRGYLVEGQKAFNSTRETIQEVD